MTATTATAPAPVNIAAARKSLLGPKKPADDPAALKAAAQKIAREEIEAKYPGFPAAWEELLSLGVGQPKLSGEFARVVSELRGDDQPKGGQLVGTGELADEGPLEDPRELPNILTALRTNLAERSGTEPTPASAPTPAPTPAASTPATSAPSSLLPPDAPASDPALATQAPAVETEDADTSDDATAALPVAEGPVKRTAGRPKGSKNKPKLPEPGTAVASGGEQSAPVAARVFVYVDCVPSCRHESLADMVHAATTELNKRAGSAGDFRLVPNDHELAYGRWKGLVASMVRSLELRPGHYVLQGAAGDVAQAVADALRDTVIASGGVVVQ